MTYSKVLCKDPVLRKLIKKHGTIALDPKKNFYLHLCNSIVGQQLSTKVARVIRERFAGLYHDKFPSPEQILGTPVTTMRGIGFSNAKASYVHNVARFAMDQGMDDKKLKKMGDEEIIEYLTPIKGVGRWTVEMLLMFTMGREDVFAVDDLGIQNAMCMHYDIEKSNKKSMKARMLEISSAWAPYRTYACLHLWRSLDNE